MNREGLWERKVSIGTDSEERRNDSAVRLEEVFQFLISLLWPTPAT
jgi:hypothetical protein